MKLVGEGADDAGGVFDDTITEMCRELVDPNSGLDLLVLTPNGQQEIGLNRDKYILNADKISGDLGQNGGKTLQHFWFLGKF